MTDVLVNLPWQTIKTLAVLAYLNGKSFNDMCNEILTNHVGLKDDN